MSFSSRMERLKITVGAARRSISSFHAGKVQVIEGGFEVTQDFIGEDSPAQLEYELMCLIKEIGAFPNQLKNRLAEIGKKHRICEVTPFFKQRRAFRLLYDLHNVDKHAGRDRHGGWSNQSPKIQDFNRLAQYKVDGAKTTAGIVLDMMGKRLDGSRPVGYDRTTVQ